MVKMNYLSAPIEVGIEITSMCNLKCAHCYASSTSKKIKNELSLSEIKKLLTGLANMKVFRIFLSGGEPFLRKDIFEIIKFAKRKNFFVVTSTNGTLINNEIIKKLKKTGIDSVQVSIDGMEKTHDKFRNKSGTFKKAVLAAKKISDIGINLSIGTTVSSLNYKDIPKILELSLKLNSRCFHIMNLQPGGRGYLDFDKKELKDKDWIKLHEYLYRKKKELKSKINMKIESNRFALLNKLLQSFKNIKEDFNEIDLCFINCRAAKSRCIITSTGNVIGCEMLRENRFIVGNIRKQKFKDIWCRSNFFNFLRNRDFRKIKGCEKCNLVKVCQGGCPAASYNMFGNIMVADPRCKIAKR